MVAPLESSSADIAGALARVKVLREMRNYDWAFATEIAISLQGFTPTIRHYGGMGVGEGPAVGVNWYLAATPDTLMIFLGGAWSENIADKVWQGYIDTYPGVDPLIYTQNTFAYHMAQYLWNHIKIGLYPRAKIFVVGYSFGGIIAPYIANAMKVYFNRTPTVSITTFGSPAFGDGDAAAVVERDEWNSWITSDDAVALIPPPLQSFPRIMAGLTVFQGRRIARFWFNPGGINIRLDGSIRPGSRPSENPIPPTQAIGNWIIASENGLENAHSINTYHARLTAAAANSATRPIADADYSPDTMDGGTVRGADEEITNRVVHRAADTTTQTIFHDASNQNPVTLSIPVARIFRVKRVNRVYWVYFGEQPICAAPHKRRAHVVCRHANGFVRALQNEAVVYPDVLITQLNLYLQAASDPAGGFTPVMNTAIGGSG